MKNNPIGKKSKPWHVEKAVKELHKKMKDSVAQWLDMYFMTVCPEAIKPHLEAKDSVFLAWLKSEAYHHDHNRIKYISDFSFSMVFNLYKQDIIVNSFDFIVAHDGGFKEPHAIAAMIYTGEVLKNL
jgi:hypothetical protein